MVPTWHSVLLCMTIAPVGIVVHALTKEVFKIVRNSRCIDSFEIKTEKLE